MARKVSSRQQAVIDEATRRAHERLRAMHWPQWTALMREAYDEVERESKREIWAARNQRARERREQAAAEAPDEGVMTEQLDHELERMLA